MGLPRKPLTAYVVVATLLCALCLVRCQGSGADAPTAPALTPVKLGYIPIAECAPLYVGIDQKFFADEGIRIELQPMKGGAAIIPALQSGDLDVGFTNIVSLVAADAREAPQSPKSVMSIVGASFERPKNSNHALLVKTESNISPSTLASPKVRVAVNTRGNVEELMLRLYVRKEGGNDAHLNLVPMAFPEMLSGLDRGDIDVASVVEPFIEPAVRSGKYRVLARQYLAVSDETPVATYAATSGWISKNKDLVARFTRAFQRATDLLKSNPTAGRDAVLSYTKIRPEDLPIIGMPAFESKLSSGELDTVTQMMLRAGFITSKIGTAMLFEEK